MRAIKMNFTKIKHGLPALLTVAAAQCVGHCFAAITCSGDSGVTTIEGQQTTANHRPGDASTTGTDCAQIEVAKDVSITTGDTIVTFTDNANTYDAPLFATAAPYALINRNSWQSPSKAVDLMYANKPTLQNAGGTINANTLAVYLLGSTNTTLINGPNADGVVGTISADTKAVEGSYTDALEVKNFAGGTITASAFALDMGYASNVNVSNAGSIEALQTDAINTIGSSGVQIYNGPSGSITATDYAVRLAQAGAPLTAGILKNQGLISTVGDDALSAPSSKSLSIHNSGQVTAGGVTALDCSNCDEWEIINQGSITAKKKTINLSHATSGLIINEFGAEIGANETSAVLASGVSRFIMENRGSIRTTSGNSLDISGSGAGFTPGATATNLKLINGGSVMAQEGAAVNMAGASYPFLASSGSIQAGANTIFADLSNHSSIRLTGYASASDAVALSGASSTGLDVFLAGSIQAGRSAVIDLNSADQAAWLQTRSGTVSAMQSAGLLADSATDIMVVNAGTWNTATTAIDLSGAAESTLVSTGAVTSTTGAAIKTSTQAVLSGSVTGGTGALQTNGSSTVLVGAALAASAESGVAVNSRGQDMVAIAPYSSLWQPIRCQTNTCQVLTPSAGSYTAPEAGLFSTDSAVSQATSSAKTYTSSMRYHNTASSHQPLITLGVVNDNNVALPSVSTEIGLDWPNGQGNPFVQTSGDTYGGNINRWPSIDGSGEANQHAIVTIAGSVYSFYSATVNLPGTERSLITIGKPNADNKTILQSDQVEVLSLDTNASVVTLQNAELLTMGTNFAWTPTDKPGMTTTITSGVKAQLKDSLLRLDNAEVNHLFSAINKNNEGDFDGTWPVIDMAWGGIGLNMAESDHAVVELTNGSTARATLWAVSLVKSRNTAFSLRSGSGVFGGFVLADHWGTHCMHGSDNCQIKANGAISMQETDGLHVETAEGTHVVGTINANNAENSRVAIGGDWDRALDSPFPSQADRLANTGVYLNASVNRDSVLPYWYDGQCAVSADNDTANNNAFEISETGYVNTGNLDGAAYAIDMLGCRHSSVVSKGQLRADNGNKVAVGKAFYGTGLVRIGSRSRVLLDGPLTGNSVATIQGSNTTLTLGPKATFTGPAHAVWVTSAGSDNTIVDQRGAASTTSARGASQKPTVNSANSAQPAVFAISNGTVEQAGSGQLATIQGTGNNLVVSGTLQDSTLSVGEGRNWQAVATTGPGRIEGSHFAVQSRLRGENFSVRGTNNTAELTQAHVVDNLELGDSFSALTTTNSLFTGDLTIASPNVLVTMDDKSRVMGHLNTKGANTTIKLEALGNIVGSLKNDGKGSKVIISHKPDERFSISTRGSKLPWVAESRFSANSTQQVTSQANGGIAAQGQLYVSFEQACIGYNSPDCQPKIIGANVIDMRSQQLGQQQNRLAELLKQGPDAVIHTVHYQDREAGDDGQPHYNKTILSLAKTWHRHGRTNTLALEQNALHIDNSLNIAQTSVMAGQTRPWRSGMAWTLGVGLEYNNQERFSIDATNNLVRYQDNFWSAMATVGADKVLATTGKVTFSANGALVLQATPGYSEHDYQFDNNLTAILRPGVSAKHTLQLGGIQLEESFGYRLNTTISGDTVGFTVRGVSQTHTLTNPTENIAEYTCLLQKGLTSWHTAVSYSDNTLLAVGFGVQYQG